MKEEPINGEVKTFKLLDYELVISPEMDAFNTYRTKFRDLANKYVKEVKVAYNANIHDFDSFIEYFMDIYESKLSTLCHKAIDMLIAEGVWSVTYEAFFEQHKVDFHLAIDDYMTMIDSFNATLEQNQTNKANMMSYVPNMIGGGHGLGGALKGMATAMAFNAVRDNIETNVIKNAKVTQAQRAELYNRLNLDILFNNVFVDYWRVFLSLVFTLRQNGKNIWWPTDESTNKSQGIFQNMSNPNFPQDKVLEVMIEILKTNPYDDRYYAFIVSILGQTKEVLALKDYFGYEEIK